MVVYLFTFTKTLLMVHFKMDEFNGMSVILQ